MIYIACSLFSEFILLPEIDEIDTRTKFLVTNSLSKNLYYYYTVLSIYVAHSSVIVTDKFC